MSPEGIVDQSLYAFQQGFVKKCQDKMLIVEYEDLISSTDKTMNKIYKWLGVPEFKHDLQNIENKYREDDRVYDLKDMHEVRATVAKTSKPADRVLSSEILNKYQGLNFWRTAPVIQNFLL